MSQSISSTSSSPSHNSSESSNELLWDVQEILAERTSITAHKQNELLVVWKTCWVPICNVKPGPVLQSFTTAPKFKFTSAAGDIFWAVEPETQLAFDVAKVQAEQQQHRVTPSSIQSDRTPRKQLGKVSKRAFAPHRFRD